MKRTYASEPTKTKHHELDDETLVYVARIIRAFAEIDDRLTLRISQLAETSESTVAVLLGTIPISSKLSKAAYFAQSVSAAEAAAHKKLFTPEFDDWLGVRNALAHSAYFGLADDEVHMVFAGSKTLTPNETGPIFEARGFDKAYLKGCADLSEQFVMKMTAEFGLEPLLERRRYKELSAHPKGQHKQKRK